MKKILLMMLILTSCRSVDYLDKDFSQRNFSRENINTYDINGYTPLMAAVRLSNYELVKQLIADGADVNKLKAKESPLSSRTEDSPDTNTALIIAMYEYSLACELMGYETDSKEECYKFNDNCKKYDDGIRSYQIRAAGYLKIIDLLLFAGADVKAVNSEGRTALHFARDRGVAGKLLKRGADINVQDKAGCTVLMQQDDYETIKFLLENGADPDLVNKDNKTVYDKFKEYDDVESPMILELIKKYMKKGD